MHIEIETIWRFHKDGSPQTAIVMLGILNEIRKTGKLTSAADHAHLSSAGENDLATIDLFCEHGRNLGSQKGPHKKALCRRQRFAMPEWTAVGGGSPQRWPSVSMSSHAPAANTAITPTIGAALPS